MERFWRATGPLGALQAAPGSLVTELLQLLSLGVPTTFPHTQVAAAQYRWQQTVVLASWGVCGCPISQTERWGKGARRTDEVLFVTGTQ